MKKFTIVMLAILTLIAVSGCKDTKAPEEVTLDAKAFVDYENKEDILNITGKRIVAVKVDRELNVRNSSNIEDSEIVGHIHPDEQYAVVNVFGDWARVDLVKDLGHGTEDYNGYWISTHRLNFIGSGATVQEPGANLRLRPGTGKVVMTVPAGTVITRVEELEVSWIKLEIPGLSVISEYVDGELSQEFETGYAWVYADYVTPIYK